MACKVTASAKNGQYRIETDYVTDPSRNTVLMRVAFTPKPSPQAGLQLYVRFDPTVNGNGGGGGGNGGADTATVDDVDRPSGPRGLRPGHRDERCQPGLCPAGVRRPRRPVRRGFRRLRRRGERRPRAARRLARPRRRPTPTPARATWSGRRALALDGSGKTTLALGFGANDGRGDRHGGGVARRRASTRPSMPTSRAGSATTTTLTNPRVEKLAGQRRSAQAARRTPTT